MAGEIKERIKKKLEKSKRKLESAKIMLENQLYEDAISRAYYAMFHAAKALLLTKNIEPLTHKGVISMLGLHFVNTGILNDSYGKMLAYGKEFRENGDYEDYYEGTNEDAELIFEDAIKFVKKIEEIIQEGNGF